MEIFKHILKLPSLELCQISAVLNQNGYSNKLVDCFVDGHDIQELDNMLPIESPRIVLSTVLNIII